MVAASHMAGAGSNNAGSISSGELEQVQVLKNGNYFLIAELIEPSPDIYGVIFYLAMKGVSIIMPE